MQEYVKVKSSEWASFGNSITRTYRNKVSSLRSKSQSVHTESELTNGEIANVYSWTRDLLLYIERDIEDRIPFWRGVRSLSRQVDE